MKLFPAVIAFLLIAIASSTAWYALHARVGNGNEYQSSIEIEVNPSTDNERVNISIFNTGVSNVRLNGSYRAAQGTGDLEIVFRRRGVEYRSIAKRYARTDGESIQWFPIGNGMGWSLPKSMLAEQYQLVPGCYEMIIALSNRALDHAGPESLYGPFVESQSDVHKICISKNQVRR